MIYLFDIPHSSHLILTDLDDLCVENILKRLYLSDLCQVAQVNRSLFQFARVEFNRRYRQKKFQLSLNEIVTTYSDEQGDSVTLYGLRNTLIVLRCFGDLICNLAIDTAGAPRFKEDKLWRYLNMYCSQSVQRLHLHHVNFYLAINFEKIFYNLREVFFVNCDFYDNLYHIKNFFPNLNNIKFDGWNVLVYRSVIPNRLLYVDLSEENMSELIMNLPHV